MASRPTPNPTAPFTAELATLRRELEAAADPSKAPAMAAYLKDQFQFLGCSAKERRAAAKPTMALGKGRSAEELLDFADACWDEPEREFQYVAADVLRKYAAVLQADHLSRVERLIRTRSWWDTVDSLAAWTVGPMVRHHPRLVIEMDRWIDDSDIWIARTAILHQLSYKADCDADRLFAYVDKRAGDTEFFIRKACGWALRQHARVDPDSVRKFVESRGDRLSGLTKREALKRL